MPSLHHSTDAPAPTKRRALLAVPLVLALLTVGCAVGPDFHPPKPGEGQAAWVGTQIKPATTQPSVTVPTPPDLAHWWTVFNDQELNSLVQRAIAANLDIKQAASRLRQARAQRTVVASAFYPEVDANGSYQYSKAVGTGTHFTRPTSELYQAGLDATWEIDVFGGTRRAVESADASTLYAIEDQRDVLVSTVAEVALDYANLRGYQRQIVIARDNLKAQEHSAVVTRQRLRGGLVGTLDVADADALAASTRATIPVLQVQVQQTIYALSILLDRPPAALLPELTTDAPIPPTPPVVPVGLPSDLLRRRPDVRRAEASVHAATAQIGVATAQLFPQFTLTGSLGVDASSLRGLAKAANPDWSIGPNITWPIFTADRIQANIKVQDELTQQALLTYRQTVLTALSDVENALVAYAREQEHRDDLQEAVTANQEAVKSAIQLYSNGLTDFLNVITAEAALYTAQNALVLSNLSLTTDLVALYKALGGGWEAAPAMTRAPATQPATKPAISMSSR